MEDHKKILKQVGTAMIVIGLLDIGAMIYCIINDVSYSSSFNVLAVIAGILLYRGGLKAARVVVWSSAFILVTVVTLLAVLPFIEPPGLLYAKYNRDSEVDPADLLFIVALGLLVWVYKRLRSPAVVNAQQAAGLVANKPKLAYALGVILPVSFGPMTYLVNNGESGQLVKAKAPGPRSALDLNQVFVRFRPSPLDN